MVNHIFPKFKNLCVQNNVSITVPLESLIGLLKKLIFSTRYNKLLKKHTKPKFKLETKNVETFIPIEKRN